MTAASSDIATLEALLNATARAQSQAADPNASAFVSANAGTGKTYVLVTRVLRLLLASSEPDRILCLTYTKAAAAEMSNRLFARLAEWTTASDEELAAALRRLTGTTASALQLAAARTLFARTIETPGGLKVQTIHSFCERLLQRFPLEAGVAPGFEVLDDATRAELLTACTDDALSEAVGGRQPRLTEALSRVAAVAASDGFDAAMRTAVDNRSLLRALVRRFGDGDDPFDGIAAAMSTALGVPAGATAAGINDALSSLVDERRIDRLVTALSGGGKSDRDAADKLRLVKQAATVEDRVAGLASYLLTRDGAPRERLMTKAVAEDAPDLAEYVERAAARYSDLVGQRRAIEVGEAGVALLRLADSVVDRYQRAKAERAALDYDDLVTRTADLLASSASAEWVLFKLDNGIEHILVDEAQDTSPLQWQVVESLAAEFFAGAGAGERLRTVFAVGDEKQSIYGFQGAAPEMFSRMGRQFAERAAAAGHGFHRVPLTLSFRSSPTVLDAVDRAFADRQRTPGLTAEATAIRHQASRLGAAGVVEVWPTEVHQDAADADAWEPAVEASGAAPIGRLAERIAATIDGWLRDGETLASEGRPLQAGDVLILVRRREPFAPAMIKALKARGIAVAGADRIRLVEQIAVEDLMALGDFLLLPEDDLALAAVLKSPLFGIDDDELFEFGYGRRGSLWQALLKRETTSGRLAAAAAQLKTWRSRADFLPPYEFYARLLDTEGMRPRMLARLGIEAGEAIDEFLALAIAYDEAHRPSLQGFLAWLRSGTSEIKRDMEQGRDEVRVMTVHGAKGLEAPVVFLPDTCTHRSPRRPGRLIEVAAADGATHLVWDVRGAARVAAVGAALAGDAARDYEEYCRLLYVAMTRARDRLYVSGFETRQGRQDGCWYDLVVAGIEPVASRIEDADHRIGFRLAGLQRGPGERSTAAASTTLAALPLPDWALRPAPTEVARSVPLAPSKLAPVETEDGTDLSHPTEPVAVRPADSGGGQRFQRGLLTHALLQHLPEIAPGRRAKAARDYLERAAAELSKAQQRSIASEVMAILEHPEFHRLFGAGAEAEVPIAARLEDPAGRAEPIRVSGQIDRILVSDREVLIVDFKTNRPPPAEITAVAEAYLLQLAAYRMVLREIYPGKSVSAALLWTYDARLMPVDGGLLDAAEKRLFDRVVT